MKNEELENLRKKYFNLVKLRNDVLKAREEIENLENNPLIKEYLRLVNFCKQNENISKKSDYELLNDFLDNFILFNNFTDTNNIYMYMGSYETEEAALKASGIQRSDCSTANYRTYLSLESSIGYCNDVVIVPANKVPDFEKNHEVIYIGELYSPKKYLEHFKTIRKSFMKDCMLGLESQEESKGKILSIYNWKKPF